MAGTGLATSNTSSRTPFVPSGTAIEKRRGSEVVAATAARNCWMDTEAPPVVVVG
jgi:hypothetical protein